MSKDRTPTNIFRDLDSIEKDIEAIQRLMAATLLKPVVTALPTSPTDGQDCYYLVDAAKGVVWHLKYLATSPSVHKWAYVGGPHLSDESATNFGSTASAVYTATPSGGTLPSLTIPLAGDYDVTVYTGELYQDTATAFTLLSYAVGAAAALDADAIGVYSGAGGIIAPGSKCRRKTDVDALAVIQMEIKVTGGLGYPNGGGAIGLGLHAKPVRVG